MEQVEQEEEAEVEEAEVGEEEVPRKILSLRPQLPVKRFTN